MSKNLMSIIVTAAIVGAPVCIIGLMVLVDHVFGPPFGFFALWIPLVIGATWAMVWSEL